MAILLCLGCSSSLSDSSSSSTSDLPTHTEKPLPPTYNFECGHGVCGRCQRQNRRLVQRCIRCETVDDVLSSGSRRSTGDNTLKPRNGLLPRYSEEEQEKDDFVIGDDEEELLDGVTASTLNMYEIGEKEEPPMYGDGENDENARVQETISADRETVGTSDAQCSIHYTKPDETLLGLSMKYKVPGQVLCVMNKLPLSTLSTTPHLLHTLPFILLPPNINSASHTPLHTPLIERQRLTLRRFQVHTRCSDWSMSKAYVDDIFQKRQAEADTIRENRLARGDREPVEPRQGGELEEAIDSWKRDEAWEKEWVASGKGKGKMGSKIRSTGEVARDAKGWSWRL